MTSKDLVTAGSLAHNLGVKSVVYGPPGAGKTPLLETLMAGGHRPVLCACEPGLATLRSSSIKTWPAYTTDAIMDFIDWRLSDSADANQFDVTCLDSGSEMCETFIRDLLQGTSKSGKKVHGEAAYGELIDKAYSKVFWKLFTHPGHVVILCKEMVWGNEGLQERRPSFPGRVLPVQFPHLYDNLMRLEPSTPYSWNNREYKSTLRCEGVPGILSRNRNRLDPIEPADLSHIIRKSLEAK